MNLYTINNFSEVSGGWYWAKRHAGTEPECVLVWRRGSGHLRIDFKYRSETDFHPDPDKSDDCSDLVLFGPVEVPQF